MGTRCIPMRENTKMALKKLPLAGQINKIWLNTKIGEIRMIGGKLRMLPILKRHQDYNLVLYLDIERPIHF